MKKLTKALQHPQLIFPFARIRARNAMNKALVWRKDALSFPPEIHFIINNVCNYRCRTCDIGISNVQKDTPLQDSPFYKNLHSKTPFLSLDDFTRIIKEAAPHGSAISFKGTEPTLTPKFHEYIQVVTDHGLSSSITTNGSMLKFHGEAYVKAGLKGLQVSLDGSPAVNDHQRGVPGGYEKTVEGIRIVHEAKKKHASLHPHIIINLTVSPFSYAHIVDALDHFATIPGVDGVVIQHYNWVSPFMETYHNKRFEKYQTGTSCISQESDPQSIKPDVLNEEIRQIKKNTSYPFSVSFKPDFSPKELEEYYNSEIAPAQKNTFCHFTYQACTITSHGDVVPHMRCYDMTLGNIKEGTLLELWNGEKYQALRRTLREHKGSLPGCAKCCGIFY